MATPQGHSPITKAAIPGNRTMAAGMVMGIIGTMTDCSFSLKRKCRWFGA
jgi:hypothetical protein